MVVLQQELLASASENLSHSSPLRNIGTLVLPEQRRSLHYSSDI